MRKLIKRWEGLFVLTLLVISTNSFSQTIVTLNQPELGTGNIEHKANYNVQFQVGYHFKADATDKVHGFIDESVTGNTPAGGMFSGGLGGGFDDRQINTDLAVGIIKGSHSVSPIGAATYSIPIKLPSGTNGTIPDLSINYHSYAPKGFLGVGWNIGGISKINRTSKNIYHDNIVAPVMLQSTTTGPITSQNSDVFELDDKRLISISGNYGANGTIYGTEQEEFNQITSFGLSGNGPSWFEVKTKQGLTIEFGNTLDSKNIPDGQNSVISWFVNKVTDNFGNSYTYQYRIENNEILLDKIEYSGNVIQFIYNDRQDKNTSYVSGYPVNENVVLSSIVVRAEGLLTRKYEFKYGLNQYKYLTEIIEYGSNNLPLNSTIFKYGDVINTASEENIPINELFPVNLSATDAEYWTGDFNGDGKTDLIALSYGLILNPPQPGYPIDRHWFDWTLHLNQGNNQYSSSTPQSFPAGFNPSDDPKSINTGGAYGNALIRNIDFNGDGLEDILFTLIEQGSYDTYKFFPYLSTGNGFIAQPTFEEYAPTYNPINGQEFTLRFLDFDGDGKLEIFTHHYILNINSPGFIDVRFDADDTAPQNIQGQAVNPDYKFKDCFPMDVDGDGRTELANIFNISDGNYYYIQLIGSQFIFIQQNSAFFTSSSISESLYGDFNGDGKSDVITYYPTSSPYWVINYSTGGSGAETEQINLGNFLQNPFLTMSNDNKEITHFTIDMNGDGKSDIVEIENVRDNQWDQTIETTINIYYSNGIGFTLKTYPISISIDTELDELDFGDFNGDGKPDLMVHKIGVGGGSGTSYNLFFFEKNGKERLLEGIADGFNNYTEFTYDYLTNNTIYTKGSNANYPVVDVQSPLPVVSMVKIPDGVGGDDITTYTYTGAKVHKNGKGFLGFEKIISENNVTNTRTTTIYKLNNTFYINSPLTQNIELINGNQGLSQTTYEYTYTNLGNNRFFSYLSKIINTDQLTNFTTTSNISYDNFGNVNYTYITKGNIETIEINNTYGQYGTWIPSSLELTNAITTRQGEPAYSRTTELVYTPQGKVAQKINDSGSPKELNTSYTYNAKGNQISTTVSANGVSPRTTSYIYDAKGRYIEKIINPLNQISTSIYDPKFGLPISVKGYDGLITKYEYDEFGTLITQTTPDNIKTEKTLNWDVGSGGVGSPTTVDNSIYTETTITPGKPTIKTWFDSFGRQRQTEMEGFNQKIYQVIGYDERGNIKTQTSPFYSGGSIPVIVTTNTYNPFNKIISSQNSAGTTTYNYSYSQNQESTTVTNPDLTVNAQVLDATGKVISASDNGGTLDYTYYSSGLQKEVKMGGITITSMEYDIQGYQTKLIDKNAGEVIYEYNAFRELIYQKDENLYEYEMEYDLLGRMVKQTEITTNLVTDYVFGLNGSGINQLISAVESENNYSEEYTYDNLGRTTEIKETIDNVDYITKFEYDNFSNIISTTYPSGYVIENTYTSFGYMNKVTNGTTVIWQGIDTDAYSNYTNFSTGNGLTVSKEYDEYGFPLHFLASNSNVLDLSFVVDVKNGNLINRENITKGLLEEFEYDNLNRLTKTTLNGIVQLNMNYVNNGNIDFKTDAGSYTYDNNRINAVLTATNPNNEISSLQQDITYTPFNSPASIIEGANELHLMYGTDQQRRKTQLLDNGALKSTKYFLGNYEKIVDAVTNDITEIHYIAGGNGLTAIYVIKNGVGELNYTYTNQLGSIVTLTDDIGNIVAEQSFDAWGRYRDPQTWQLTSTSGISSTYSWLTRGYTRHEHLPEFGLINMNGRVYDPVLARMLSVDNFVAAPFSTQAYNRYSYVFNNPLKFVDPNGENPILVGAIIGFLIGAYYGLEYGSNKGARGWSLVRYTVGGGIIGGIAGALGAGVAAGGGAFANTGAIVAGSFSNAVGMHIFSGGESDVSVSYGFGSYNFNTNDFGYLGEKNNTFGQNFSYGLGALANLNDIVTLNVQENNYELYTDDEDLFSHSGLRAKNSSDPSLSFGPNDSKVPSTKAGFALKLRKGTPDYDFHDQTPLTVDLTLSKNVVSATKTLSKAFPYQGCSINCVNVSSLGLWLNGVPNIGLHPYLLYGSIKLYEFGFRPDIYSYHFNK